MCLGNQDHISKLKGWFCFYISKELGHAQKQQNVYEQISLVLFAS